MQEQDVPLELEQDGRDNDCVHFLITSHQRPFGTGRLRPIDSSTVKLERMAILPENRGQGFGRMLLDTMLSYAEEKAFDNVVLHAQSSAIGFYKNAGFEPDGDTFMEAGISHLKMIKPLAKDQAE